MRLTGATALVTGATGGIGRAVAEALHARGAGLVLTGRRQDRLDALARPLAARAIRCDLADRVAVEALIAEVGAVDVLVANAGIPAGGDIRRLATADVDLALEVNLRAPMVLARGLIDGMVTRGGGHIVFMSSLSGWAASPGGSVYSATKFGLRGFALGLREDLHDAGVGVSTIFPGFVSEAGMFADSGATLPPYIRTRRPEQVARAVVTAIERNRSEVAVAPLPMSLGSRLAGLVPELAARVQRLAGAQEMSSNLTEAQARRRQRSAPGEEART